MGKDESKQDVGADRSFELERSPFAHTFEIPTLPTILYC